MDKVQRCEAVIYKRDTYRVARGAPGGFKMHYDRCQCTRAAVKGGLCWQHAKATHWIARYA